MSMRIHITSPSNVSVYKSTLSELGEDEDGPCIVLEDAGNGEAFVLVLGDVQQMKDLVQRIADAIQVDGGAS